MNLQKVFLFITVLSIVFSLSAQTGYYLAQAPKLRADVWAWDNPAFKNYTVPEELKNESAVLLARHRHVDATATKSSLFWGTPGKLCYTDIDRKMVLINDQTALAHFSEFSFKEKNIYGSSYTYYTNSSVTIFGARIIKPDGTIKEIDVSKSSVSITEGINDKESYKKLAIPELQINDILDFFDCEIYELETFNMPEQSIAFYSIDYPALHSSCCLNFGRNLTIEYRSINGAPQLSKTTDTNGNIVLTAESRNIMRVNDFENIRWFSPLRDLPMIRFVVLQNASKTFYKPVSARAIGVHENVPYQTILEDAKYYLMHYKSFQLLVEDIRYKVSETVRSIWRREPNITKVKMANLIYTALNYEWTKSKSNYPPSAIFILILTDLFKEFGINSNIGFVTHKNFARIDEVLTYDDFMYLVAANNATQFFFPPYRYRVPGEIPSGFQGEHASTYVYTNYKGFWNEMVTLPETFAEENMNKTLLQVSFNHKDMQKIDLKRHSTWIGDVKSHVQPWLLLYEDWDNEMRRFLKIEKSYIEELNMQKKTRKLIPEVESNFAKNREKHSETIEREVEQYHGFKPDVVKEFTFTSLGVTLDKPQLEYDISYTMGDFVRYAGGNLILDAGKLIGQQWNPTENDRNRNTDAYIPTRRIFENEIVIQIPTNYTIGNVEHLNVNFSNEYAAFEAVTVIENNTVNIKTKKTYKQSFISKEDWHNFIEILDKTNTFYSSSVVLQKDGE